MAPSAMKAMKATKAMKVVTTVVAKTTPIEPQKKPAASKVTVASQVAEFKKGVHTEDEANRLRDKAKGEKFAKMKASGSLPDHVLELFDKEATKKESPRAFRSMVVNKLFQKDAKGHWQVCLDDRLFVDAKITYEKNTAEMKRKPCPNLCLGVCTSRTPSRHSMKLSRPVMCRSQWATMAKTTVSSGISSYV